MSDGEDNMANLALDDWTVNDALALPAPIGAAYPDLDEALRFAASFAWDTKRDGLPLHIREIVAVAVLAHMGYPGIETHMRRALEAGASIRQIAEALMTISTPGGQRCLAYGLPRLTALVEELGETALAPPAEPVAPRTVRGLTASSAWPWLDEHFAGYQGSRRELSRLAFVPENPALETRYREILVAVVLSCRGYFTVMEHAQRAIEEGATLTELVDGVYIGSLFGGGAVFRHALPFLTEVHDEIEAGTLAPH